MGEHVTPESELCSIECFQNYTASEVFVQGLAGIVHQQDVESMIRAQKHMLQRFEKTNEMLVNCNTLCESRLRTASAEFKKHTVILMEMKKDLDNIFHRVQTLKSKTSALYPESLNYVPEKEAEKVLDAASPSYHRQPNEGFEIKNLKRDNSSSSDSINASHNDSSPYTSDTG